MRGHQEHLNAKIQDFKNHGTHYEYTERSTKTRTGETDKPRGNTTTRVSEGMEKKEIPMSH